MAIPISNDMDISPATYFVYRDTPAGEPFDPTSPLLFFPPKGSDELFDALREAFPHLKTHSERMRDAIIKYLLEEREGDQSQASPAIAVESAATAWPSVSSSVSGSVLNSPDILNMSTSAYSPQSNSPQLTRQASAATSSQPSPPSLDQMTNVFCLSNRAQPKQRVRRKMTEAEKVEYRKRRIVKACENCAKRKRKCPHNQTKMETVNTHSKSGSRSSKSVSPKSTQSLAAPTSARQVANGGFVPLGDLGTFPADVNMDSFQSFNDFTMFDDSYQEFSVNDDFDFEAPNNVYPPFDIYMPGMSAQRWSSNDDLTSASLMDPVLSDQLNLFNTSATDMGANELMHTELFDPDTLFQQHSPESDFQQQSSTDSQVSSLHANTAQVDRSMAHGSRVSTLPALSAPTSGSRVSRVPIMTGQEESTLHRFGKLPAGPQRVPSGGEGLGGNGPSGNGMLWEHLRTGQNDKPQPTHTAHVHDAGCGELFSLAEQNGALKEPFRKPFRSRQLPDVTLRLVTTTRAVNSFTGLIRSRTSDRSSRSTRCCVPMERVLALLPFEAGRLVRAPMHSSLFAQHSRPLQEASALYDVQKRQAIIAHESDWHEGVIPTRAANGVSQKELRQQTSTSVSHNPSGESSAALPQGRPQTIVSERREVASFSRPAQSREGPARSLGEGMDNLAEPAASTLFTLRRRISRSENYARAGGRDILCMNCETRRTWATGHNDSLSAQANGGAYPRLESNDPSSDFCKKASEILRAQGPSSSPANRHEFSDPHRPDEASASTFMTRSSRETTVASNAQAVDRNLAALDISTHRAHLVWPDRNTRRHKDHHGRREGGHQHAPAVLSTKDHLGCPAFQAGLGFALLAILASAFAKYINATVLLLALLGPVSACVGHGRASPGQAGAFAQCTEANSAWRSGWQILAHDLLRKTTKNGDVLQSLTYAFALAPRVSGIAC